MLLAEAPSRKRKPQVQLVQGLLMTDPDAPHNKRMTRDMPKKSLNMTREEKKTMRQQLKQQCQRPKRFQNQTFLETMAVSQPVAEDYHRRMQSFFQFLRMKKMPQVSLRKNTQKLDEACNCFMNYMFDQGFELAEGTKFLAAVCDTFPGCGPKHILARTRRSLQGWLKLEPQRTRPPLPWALVAAMTMHMMKRHQLHAAAAILLSFTAYLRPGEVLDLRKTDLVAPMPRQEHWSLLLHPAERQERSKVGLADESILLDSPLLPWLGPALNRLQTPNNFLLSLTYYDLVQAWQGALKALGLAKDHAVLYQLRHSGPSHDRFFKLRPLTEVKQRGRWAADSTVRRYEAHARLNQEFNDLPKHVQNKAQLAEQEIVKAGPKFFGL